MSGAANKLVEFYVEKSKATLIDAKLLAVNKGFASSVNRLYYACFYIVTALVIDKTSVRVKRHAGLRALFNNEFVRTGIISVQDGAFYSALMEKRDEADYGDFEVITEDEINTLVIQTEAFINTIKKLVV